MKQLYCITCPNGCKLSVTDQSSVFSVEGNGCDRGAEFAYSEMTNPVRTLTTTVCTTFPSVPVLPVRTDGEIPKNKIVDVMRALSKVMISRELDCGDTVIENIAGTGVRVIATSDALHRESSEAEVRGSKSDRSDRDPAARDFGFWNPKIKPMDENGEFGEDDENDDDNDSGSGRDGDGGDDGGDSGDSSQTSGAGYRPSKGKALLRPNR